MKNAIFIFSFHNFNSLKFLIFYSFFFFYKPTASMDHQKKERKLNKQKICCNITTVCPLSPLFPKVLRMISLFLGLEVVGVKSGLDLSLFLEEPGETGRAGAGHRDMHGLTHTHTHTPTHTQLSSSKPLHRSMPYFSEKETDESKRTYCRNWP